MTKQSSRFADMLRQRETVAEDAAPPKRGRPGGRGKRLNPDYSQVTAYIPAKLHEQTKINLIRQGNREFSTLVEELLTAWNGSQAGQ